MALCFRRCGKKRHQRLFYEAKQTYHATNKKHFSCPTLNLDLDLNFQKKKKNSSANERTFLAWLSMAVSLGGVSTALVGFTAEEKPGSASKHPGVLRRKTVDLISVLLLPVSIAMIGYALFIFLCRSRSIRTKQVGFFTDWLGPAVLAGVLLLVLLTITVAAFASVIAG